jgi:hypothetical protein
VREAQAFEAEVEHGLANEERILARWRESSARAKDARGFLKGGTYDDFDFVVFDKRGVVICYLEVKLRRSALARFGDVMFPARKHAFAKQVLAERKTPVVAVTEYGCGALVEVDLALPPESARDIVRRDRPGMKPVPHVFYGKSQMTVLVKGS